MRFLGLGLTGPFTIGRYAGEGKRTGGIIPTQRFCDRAAHRRTHCFGRYVDGKYPGWHLLNRFLPKAPDATVLFRKCPLCVQRAERWVQACVADERHLWFVGGIAAGAKATRSYSTSIPI